MKRLVKYSIILFCISIMLTIASCASANSSQSDEPNRCFIYHIAQSDEDVEKELPSSTLPTSLITIEENAFEGTALVTVVLPEKVETIEDNAFANIATLKQINIPNSTTFIGKDTFKGSNRVTITAAPESYARAYARENKIPFNPITSFYAFVPSPQTTSITNRRAELIPEGETTGNQKMNQTGRMTGDLKADRYERITAFHIQGRSPPMGL